MNQMLDEKTMDIRGNVQYVGRIGGCGVLASDAEGKSQLAGDERRGISR